MFEHVFVSKYNRNEIVIKFRYILSYYNLSVSETTPLYYDMITIKFNYVE